MKIAFNKIQVFVGNKLICDLHPIVFSGPKAHIVIKRTRKRGIEKAKFMDHASYEWSQWWKKKARKPKRWKYK